VAWLRSWKPNVVVFEAGSAQRSLATVNPVRIHPVAADEDVRKGAARGPRTELKPTVFYLIGRPGAGKFTVAKAMERVFDGRGERLVVVDNHYINNPIFGLVHVDGATPLPAAVWDRVGEVGEAVYTTIETISPKAWSFVFSNYLVQDEPSDLRLYKRVRRVATTRSSRFVPVRLLCDTDELCRRVTSEERRERLKITDPGLTRRLASQHQLLVAQDENTLALDVTDLGPDEAAEVILGHALSLKG
jgi:hypothetical protein